ncbi:hypothetical protein HMPREF1544_07011 [Mucor circinelloides 1006PhL]|uniref:Uncharacterized protein n=1 Tax=Mucor circinelloides f. circinelloides (strain 1006PhL) TaxID=1220926 RepID=S2J970_MUCC1|nr:hypothetical protein HMPREF1544_07011 [Mucor circinelloides 1006PhL]
MTGKSSMMTMMEGDGVLDHVIPKKTSVTYHQGEGYAALDLTVLSTLDYDYHHQELHPDDADDKHCCCPTSHMMVI